MSPQLAVPCYVSLATDTGSKQKIGQKKIFERNNGQFLFPKNKTGMNL